MVKKQRVRRLHTSKRRSFVHRVLVAWEKHERTRKPTAFYRTTNFKIFVILALFGLAVYLKGEHFTTTVLVARIADAIGDVITDSTFTKGE